MFTGIVETTGEVASREATDDGLRLRIAAPGLDDLHHGQSIAVSGVCLTVETYGSVTDEGVTQAGRTDERATSGAADGTTGDAADGTTSDAATNGATDDAATDGGVIEQPAEPGLRWFEVFCAEETIEQTYLGELGVGDAVNIERALPADGRFDGHLVQGHVDTTAEITSIDRVGEDWRFGFSVPDQLAPYLVHKGSVAVDGISLTIADRTPEAFEVAIIPTTYQVTNLSEKSVGDPVHLEADIVAKYVESMLEGYADAAFGQ